MSPRRDRPKNPTMRVWMVKVQGHPPVEVEAEHRGAARHYVKSALDDPHLLRKGAVYLAVEWARLKR